MAFSELIKNFAGIRNYMRQFLVYGFRSRDEFDAKSGRSYDNEKRRVESWLADYMSFRRDSSGKSVFLSVDSRNIPHNPLYKAWKASSFTRNDITLHFMLLDILTDEPLDISEILEIIDTEYMSFFESVMHIDESTLRKKIKEYVELGIIVASKQGKKVVYSLAEDSVDIEAWKDVFSFFSESNPLGVVGSYLIDKFDDTPDYFSFKHRYLLFALDSEVMLNLSMAIHSHCSVELELLGGKNGKTRRCKVLPLKVFISVQGGRQYLASYNTWKKMIYFFRIDTIQKVKPLEVVEDFETYQEILEQERKNIWGVSVGQGVLEDLEMILKVAKKDAHIVHRLKREKRCGEVVQLDEEMWKFTASVYDATELVPWLRTFIGRISSLTCSNKRVEEQFWKDLSIVSRQYGVEDEII